MIINIKKLKFIDSHCHLDFPELNDNLEELILLANNNSIKKIITICTKLSEIEKIINISNKFKNVWFTIGIHPHEASFEKNAFNKENLFNIVSSLDKCVGIGEAGLDYYYKNSSIDDQKKSFLMQIEVARSLKKPIVIHSRDADEEMINILTSEYKKGTFKGVMHCFTGSEKLSNIAINLGLYISFSGILTFKKSLKLHAIASNIPKDKYLIETDSPFLSPEPFRGKVNNPSNVYYVAKFLANLRNVPISTISDETWTNTCSLFSELEDKI